MASRRTLLAALAAALCWITLVQAEMFTALVEMEKALTAERLIADDIRHYITLEETRLMRLREIADDYEHHSMVASVNPESYLSNPINAFLLVKRFTADWGRVENLIRNNTADDFMQRLQSKASSFPNQEDLSGAATALLRLQDTYALKTSMIAKGDLQGVKYSPPLNVEDCFDLGHVAYNAGDYYHTLLWMEQTRSMLREQPFNGRGINVPLILDYLSYSYFMQGNTRAALNHTIDWLQIEPDHVRAMNNMRFYQEQLQIEEEARRKGDEGIEPPPFENKRILDDYRAGEEFQTYEALCRGEDLFPDPNKHKYTCQYRRHYPIFYIRPLKEETMYYDPLIIVYHDVMVDDEIAEIKKIASPRLHRSGVFSLMESNDTKRVSRFRTSKSAWLHDWEHPHIQAVSTKVRFLANLTLDTAEELQVVNYGIGGHYEPHYDFARKEEKGGFDPAGGNRIATAIFYMTDVEAGGGTVFTTLGVKLWPEKGAIALWYNLKRNGEGDYSTRHAACPVLAGNKWVANKWIHERGQEFERPCDVDPML